MRVELNIISESHFSLGLFVAEGEDEYGEFKILTVGLFLFSIDLFVY
jgi:hypothetical protein